jgi:hypothetical protein
MMFKSTFSVLFAAILSLVFSASIQAANYTGNSDLFIILKKDGTVPMDRDFHVTVQIDVPQSSTFQLSPSNPLVFENVVGSYKTGSCKDGKVDVDIIIRGGSLKPIINGNTSDEDVKIKLFVCEVITVDNISGVYQASGSGSTGHAARVSKTTTHVEVNSGESNGLSSIPVVDQNAVRAELFPTVANTIGRTTEDVVLYPNPVTDGVLNINGNDVLVAGAVTIHNALGATVASMNITGDEQVVQFPLENLSKGVYYARIKTNDGLLIKKFNVIR